MAGVADIGIRVFLMDQLTAPLYAIDSSLGLLGREAERTGGALKAMSDTQLGFAALGLSIAALAAFLIWAGSVAGNFDQMMDHISVSVRGATGPALDQLATNLVNVADASIYTDTQIAEGINELGVLQFTAAQLNAQNGVLIQSMVNLAEATGVEPVKAATLLGSTMRMFGLQATDAAKAADLLDFAFHNGLPNVDQLTQALNQVGPVAYKMGFSLQDTVMALDLLAQAGLRGSMAGTDLRYMLSNLIKPTNAAAAALQEVGFYVIKDTPALEAFRAQLMNATGASSKAADGFDGTYASLKKLFAEGQKAGLIPLTTTFQQWVDKTGAFTNKLYDANGHVRTMKQVIDDLIGSMKKMTPEQAAAAIEAIFGARAGQAALIMAGHVKDFDKIWAILQSHLKDTSAAKDAKKATDNLTDSWNTFKTTFMNAVRVIGEQTAPSEKKLLDWANGILSDFIRVEGGSHDLAGKIPGIWGQMNDKTQLQLLAASRNLDKFLSNTATEFSNWQNDTRKTINDWIGTTLRSFDTWAFNMTFPGQQGILNFTRGILGQFPMVANAISTLIGDFGDWLSSLPGKLYQWAVDAIGSFIQGLWDKVGGVNGPLGWLSQQIANFLQHSTPKMGPLAGDDQWMPHMVNMWADQLRAGVPLITRAAQGLASTLVTNTGLPQISNPVSSSISGGSLWGGTGGRYGGAQTFNLVLDGKIIAQYVMNDLTGQLQLNGTGRMWR